MTQGLTQPLDNIEALPRVGPRIRLFNVKFSPNLGDGLLSECLEQALIDAGASADTWSIDLAARTAYGEGAEGRALKMRVLGTFPDPVRKLAVRAPLAIQGRRSWMPHYLRSLEGAQCAVIGGGNLIADLDLNFPTKLSLALAAAAWRNLPVFIYGCGVSSGWSRQGLTLMKAAVRRGNIRKVWVRDERSRRIWNELIGHDTTLAADTVRDPGLLASSRYAIRTRPFARSEPLIGLNLTSPLAVRYHASHAPGEAELTEWYVELARSLLDRGYRLAVFSNGSPEDREYTCRLHAPLMRLDKLGRVSFPVIDTPAELTRLIAGCAGIAAFRMHAIIAAYSCGVPFLALSWDPKLESFVRSVNRADWLCPPVRTSSKDAGEQLIKAMDQGIAPGERARVAGQTRQGVSDLLAEIYRAIG
ncbi:MULTISPECIES: polysaccharide pyruvyl transferase family protein [unclassified Novosphingobium]|uniref:polysaccharide pyruvyl transferase family protein n=1 Tax=unclassified Novosphingobium TaxID=2644732 RepID=UPI00020EF3F3|nr:MULTISPECIES: polysaccharide pyruvyl transferase family protein [unclassified Novosphingobium]GFM27281.1 polysaccharide pyruvyl transferase [Novosphingobium sp. PY1]CCA94044.1 polysaccharide pyruvyl transferase [Novosphingobium sp. PP1Y]